MPLNGKSPEATNSLVPRLPLAIRDASLFTFWPFGSRSAGPVLLTTRARGLVSSGWVVTTTLPVHADPNPLLR